MAKKPTYRFFVQDKEGNSVNIDTLSEEERKEVGVWAYQTLLKGLGYEPVGKIPEEELRCEEQAN